MIILEEYEFILYNIKVTPLKILRKHMLLYKTKWKLNLKVLRTDNGMEFVLEQFDVFCRKW